ncbi:MAG: aspartate aminotransferase family protein [Alphaproteobacteria bacterium]|nr:aspartate aminotransferase family protein [Alphaproteobacteria bacterium]
MILDNVGTTALPITPCSAEGALLWDTNGKTYWDFYGGHAVTLLGQGHPRWVAAIADQAKKLSFFTTLAPVPVRDRAAQKLTAFTGMDVVFFVNSGAEANEGALKIARKATGRPVVVAFEHGFHGRTMGALGATWKYRDQHTPAYGATRFVPFGDLAALDEALGPDVAAVIVEPVQGIAGVVVPPAGFLQAIRQRCDAVGAVMICDEVQCGIGRMGVPLVSTSQGIRPDLVTVGKGLGGGFPVAAVLLTHEMAGTVKPGEHGTTFGGGPLACAAVEATIDIVESEGLLEKSNALFAAMQSALAVPGVQCIRGGGAWAGVVLDRPARPVAAALLEMGFMVGTASDPFVLRLAPPAVTPVSAVFELADALERAIALAPRISSAA